MVAQGTDTRIRFRRIGLAVIGVALIASGGSAVGFAQETAATSEVAVKVAATADQKPVITGTGSIIASKTSRMGPLVTGRIEKINVDVGDVVKKGDELFTTRTESFVLRVEAADARLAISKARLKQAKITLDRQQKLLSRGVASQSVYDEAESAFQVAETEVESAEVAVRQAQRDLADAVVTAPYDAVVTARFIDEGVFMAAGGGGNPVVKLQKIDVVRAVIKIPARDISRLSAGAKARLRIDGVDAPVLTQINVVNDEIDVQTRDGEIRVLIDNADRLIKPGMLVQAEFTVK